MKKTVRNKKAARKMETIRSADGYLRAQLRENGMLCHHRASVFDSKKNGMSKKQKNLYKEAQDQIRCYV